MQFKGGLIKNENGKKQNFNYYSPTCDLARSEYTYVSPLKYEERLEDFRTNSVVGIGTTIFDDEKAGSTLYEDYELVWGYEGTTPVLFDYNCLEWHIVNKIPAVGKKTL